MIKSHLKIEQIPAYMSFTVLETANGQSSSFPYSYENYKTVYVRIQSMITAA